MVPFFHGIAAAAFAIAGLFFLRFYVTSRDRLFAFFAVAFFTFACNWTVISVVQPAMESRHLIYVARLAAFVLIIAAILDKNRRSR